MKKDQVETGQKENSKKNVTFSSSIDIVQINPLTKEFISNNKNDPNNFHNNNEAFIRRYSVSLEQISNVKKRMARRYSLRGKGGKEVSSPKKKNLGVIKEIILGDNNEGIITNKNKSLFGLKGDEDGKKKKKINFIQELRRFDREQQMKVEEYIDKKRRQQNELMFKSSKLFKLIKPKEKEDDIINGFMSTKKIKDKKNKTIAKEKEDPSQNERSFNSDENDDDDKDDNGEKNKKNNNIIDTNKKNDFQKVKKKYFSQNIFNLRFPETEFKIKYFDNYLRNDSLKKNLFNNFDNDKEKEKKENININNENRNNNNNNIKNNIDINKNINNNNINANSNTTNAIINNSNIQTNINASNININNLNNNINNNDNGNYINIYQNIFKTPLGQKKNAFNKYYSNDLKSKTNNIVSTDSTNTLIETNIKYNNKTEQSINTNIYLMNGNRYHKRSESDEHIDNTYQMIINSIDEKLYEKSRSKNNSILSGGGRYNRDFSSSSEKIKNYSIDYKNHKNIFRSPVFQTRGLTTKNYYKDICDKFDKYNGLKMTSHLRRNKKRHNNIIRNYKFLRVMNEINGIKKYIK